MNIILSLLCIFDITIDPSIEELEKEAIKENAKEQKEEKMSQNPDFIILVFYIALLIGGGNMYNTIGNEALYASLIFFRCLV